MTWPARPSTTCDGVWSAALTRAAMSAIPTATSARAIRQPSVRLVAFFEVVLVDLVIVELILLLGRCLAERVVHGLPAPLHIGIAHEGIVVERSLLRILDRIEKARALVDDVDRAGPDRHVRNRDEVGVETERE